jgi:AcrR family transcriptional regulator
MTQKRMTPAQRASALVKEFKKQGVFRSAHPGALDAYKTAITAAIQAAVDEVPTRPADRELPRLREALFAQIHRGQEEWHRPGEVGPHAMLNLLDDHGRLLQALNEMAAEVLAGAYRAAYRQGHADPYQRPSACEREMRALAMPPRASACSASRGRPAPPAPPRASAGMGTCQPSRRFHCLSHSSFTARPATA